MADIPNNSQAPSAGLPANTAPKKAASPWEEELDLPKPQPKASVVGTLHPTAEEAQKTAAPFSVPKNVDEKVGQKVAVNQDQAQAPVTTVGTDDFDFLFGSTPNPNPPKPPAKELPADSSSSSTPSRLAAVFKQTPVSGQTQSPPQNPALPAEIEPPANQSVEDRIASLPGEKNHSFFKHPFLTIGIPCLLFVMALILFTETGIISIGAEKVYGAVGLEKLWGGLSKNIQSAILYSGAAMKEHQEFKATGTITLTVNKYIKSQITTPLVSYLAPEARKQDNQIAFGAVKATKTSDYYYYDTTSTPTATDDASDSNSTSDLDTADSSSSVSDSTYTDTTSTSSSSSTSATSVTETGSTVQQVEGSITLISSGEGQQADIKVQKDGGTDIINLINSSRTLWVRSSDNIKFDKNSAADKWVKYSLEGQKSENAGDGIFSLSDGSGLSVTGKRLGNEKLNGVRTYHYQIDSLEVGNVFQSIGIDSDSIQSITGDVWIGIKDKFIRKIELKITLPSANSISLIQLQLEFDNFDQVNQIITPSSSTVVEPGGFDMSAINDEQRKNDVDNILSALQYYKSVSGSYPISKDLLKLNESGNIIESILVPNYLTAMPTDPKASEGWYYAYKSNDGTTCSVSARVENSSFAEAEMVNNILLYLKYNNN